MEEKPDSHAPSISRAGNAASDVEEMIRVDHAGEYGAVRIYQGQQAVFRYLPQKQEMQESLARMAGQEEVHLARFNALMHERGVRPTALAPVWHVAGFALGAVTALMGEKAAHACTEAIETVIDEHYADQIARLERIGKEPELKETIAQFRREEVEHRDEAIAAGSRETPGHALLTGAIKTACRVAIKLSEKV